MCVRDLTVLNRSGISVVLDYESESFWFENVPIVFRGVPDTGYRTSDDLHLIRLPSVDR